MRAINLLFAASLLIWLMFSPTRAAPTTTTTEQPDSDTDDDPTFAEADQRGVINQLFSGPLTRSDAKFTMARAMQMLDHQPGPSRGENIDA